MRTIQTFRLDPTLFTPSLYTTLLSVWFADLPPNARAGTATTAARWFGKDASASSRAAFDNQCRTLFGPALQSVGPSRLTLPPFISHAQDTENAEAISAPFLDAITPLLPQRRAQAADTLLALLLLLDQIPRNIFRENAGLRTVYTHYDRMAQALVRATMPPLMGPPALMDEEAYRRRFVYRAWFLVPLMHAEDVGAQRVLGERYGEWEAELKAEVEREGGEDAEGAVAAAAESVGFARLHREIIERFGRFPHRDESLGRGQTEEERAWLRESGATFGVQQAQE